ncbi:MAG: LLM class flavin-dependent oxidoreductase [Myxococcota bacterium]
MQYDVFFSISQTPVDGEMPSESEMLRAFFEQVQAADDLGFGVAWVAESHLSTQAQKKGRHSVVPYWQGEIGLNVDICQLAHQVFTRTRRIEVGSAVMNLLSNGGPIAAAERIAYFVALHGLDPEETRRLHVGFSAGRFDFMNRAYGITPRTEWEESGWPAVRHKVFTQATEIFLRLLRGDELDSSMLEVQHLSVDDFPSLERWEAVQRAAGHQAPAYRIEPRYVFEPLRIVPATWRRELLQLVIGTHDPELQITANRWLPVQVFNLSLTPPQTIEETHRRMEEHYRGDWQRGYMPRTVLVFINDEPGLDEAQRAAEASQEAERALGAYWTALEGTISPERLSGATDNALIGTVDAIAEQIGNRFHPDDRLMLWFDFFNHDCARVMRNMRAFAERVMPRVEQRFTAAKHVP